MAQDQPPRRGADRARRQHEFALFQRQHLAAHDPRRLHPACDPDREHDQHEGAEFRPHQPGQGFAKQHHHDQQQRQQRQRQKQVGYAHQRPVEALEIARQHPDHGAERHRDRHCHQPDRDRDLAARDHPRQHVAAQLIGAERIAEAWPLIAQAQHLDRVRLDELGVNRPQPRPQHDRHQQGGKHRKPDQRALVGLELIPDIAPLVARRA